MQLRCLFAERLLMLTFPVSGDSLCCHVHSKGRGVAKSHQLRMTLETGSAVIGRKVIVCHSNRMFRGVPCAHAGLSSGDPMQTL
eukprot:s4263_g7.t1